MEDPKNKKIKRLVDFQEDPEFATFSELQEIGENVESIMFEIDLIKEELKEEEPEKEEKEIVFPDKMSVDNFPEVQMVKVLNFPLEKESKEIDLSETNAILRKILEKENEKEEPLQINVTLTLE